MNRTHAVAEILNFEFKKNFEISYRIICGSNDEIFHFIYLQCHRMRLSLPLMPTHQLMVSLLLLELAMI